tara:strand:- start:118 stop:267 length:150 start_codon:yes stop_codon:yes gene_type:complete
LIYFFNKGVSAHQAGQLQEAEHCYKNIIQTQSAQPHDNNNDKDNDNLEI